MNTDYDYSMDACSANGPVLVARDIANYLRRISSRPAPANASALEIRRVQLSPKGHVELLEDDESALPGHRECFTVYYHAEGYGNIAFADLPTAKAAEFLAESAAALWGITAVTNHITKGHTP